MTSNDQIARLNEHKPPFIELLNGKIIAADSEAQSCTFKFRPKRTTVTPLMWCKVASSP